VRFASGPAEPDEGLAAERRLARLVADPFAPRGLSLAARYRATRLAALRKLRSRWGAFVGWNEPDGERAEFANVDGELHQLSQLEAYEAGVRLALLARLAAGRQDRGA
jgi:hypothetical protein